MTILYVQNIKSFENVKKFKNKRGILKNDDNI